jgi:hypothetical protein
MDGRQAERRPPIVIAASAPPDKVAALQKKLGRDAAGALVEEAMAAIAEALVARRRAAGSWWRAARPRARSCSGWASPACASARRSIPGVPWTYATPARPAPGAEDRAISARATSS